MESHHKVTNREQYQKLTLHAIAGAEALERIADKAVEEGDLVLVGKLEELAAQLRNFPLKQEIRELFQVED